MLLYAGFSLFKKGSALALREALKISFHRWGFFFAYSGGDIGGWELLTNYKSNKTPIIFHIIFITHLYLLVLKRSRIEC